MAADNHGPWSVGDTTVLAVLCLLCMAVVLAVGILPRAAELRSCDRAVRALQAAVHEQATLQPVLAELRLRAARTRVTTLTVPPRSRLKGDQMPGLTALFAGMARDTGLELVYAVPEAKSLSKGSQRVLVNVLVQGPVAQFRAFLQALVATPCLDHVDRVTLRRGSPNEELRLQVWFAIE